MNDVELILISAPSPHATSIVSHRMQGLPPLGLGYIASFVNNNGYNSKIIDMNIWDVTIYDLEEAIKKCNKFIVGISTTTETYRNGIRIAKFLKEYDSSIVVFMGGCHVTYEYEDALNSGYVDLVIRGEGEITTKEVCDYYLNNIGELENIDGISYIVDGITICNNDREFIAELDKLPFPDRTLFDLEKYPVAASISSSRGCPGKCIFCAASRLSGGRYRVRSAENIIEEFKYLKSLGYKHVQIVDDTMTANLKRFNKFLDLMISENLGMTWHCESRVDIINEELLDKVKKAGCKLMQFGVEAASQKMLDSLRKNITLEQIMNVFTWCREKEINTASCLIIGQPYDTLETVKETVKFGLKLQKLGARIVFSISTPYPGTYMYDNKGELGIDIIDYDFDNYTTITPVYNSKYMTAEQIQACYFDAYIALGKAESPKEIKDYWKNVRKKGNEAIV